MIPMKKYLFFLISSLILDIVTIIPWERLRDVGHFRTPRDARGDGVRKNGDGTVTETVKAKKLYSL
jgi:hypothetical protein